jgi:limonene-1,2-epoxide hydrolase
MNDSDKLEAARQMFAAWEARDWDGIIARFAANGTLHSMMSEPVTGHEALQELFAGFKDSIEALTIDIEYLGVIEGAVISVRTDRVTVNGRQGALPTVGLILYDDNGKIEHWREYFDRATLLSEMGVDSDWVQEVNGD